MAEECMKNEVAAEEKLAMIHKKERKELQAKIQTMKHAVPKGDKRRKKEVASEIALLEKELEEKQLRELAQVKNNAVDIEHITNDLGETNLDGNTNSNHKSTQKLSKAQKRREKKNILRRDREQRIAQEMLENVNSPRNAEAKKLREITRKRNLTIHRIPSDGNCMYSAIVHQLKVKESVTMSVEGLRHKAASYMQSHMDDFLPFLTSPKTGEMMTFEEFTEYCNEIATTLAWGGQIELRALSHVLGICIEVLQADGPSIIIGDQYGHASIILSYHRHEYGLGEHYNSVIPRESAEDDKEEEEEEIAPS